MLIFLKFRSTSLQPPANDVEAWCRLCFGRLRPTPRPGNPATNSTTQIKVKTPVVLDSCAIIDTQANSNQQLKPGSEMDGNIPVQITPGISLPDKVENKDVKTDVKFPAHEGILPLGIVLFLCYKCLYLHNSGHKAILLSLHPYRPYVHINQTFTDDKPTL